jgi:apolipoprotein N-acyltransferase
MFVQGGAEVLVNMSNDAWSHQLTAQMQHLSMAVFRAVENRRAMVRATASGMTCGIDPNGKIIAMAEPFKETSLTVNVPLMKVTSLYTRFGDWMGVLFTILGVLFLCSGLLKYCIISLKSSVKKENK